MALRVHLNTDLGATSDKIPHETNSYATDAHCGPRHRQARWEYPHLAVDYLTNYA